MKCLVCSKEYTGGVCPKCQFPNVQIAGDYEEGIQALEPMIKSHRDSFLQKISISIDVLRRDPNADINTFPSTVRICFGKASELIGKRVWLNYDFARLPNSETVKIRIVIDYGTEVQNLDVDVPNITDVGVQNIGIDMKDNHSFSLLLRNNSKEGNLSSPVEFL